MTNLTFVKYPSNHNFLRGARIVIIGGDENWRGQFINQVNDIWIEEDINFFFVDEKEKMDIERTSWLMNQIMTSDFLVAYIEDKTDPNTLLNLGFAGINIDNPNTFVLFDETENLNIVQTLYSSYNKNNFCETENEVIITMRSIYVDMMGIDLIGLSNLPEEITDDNQKDE